MAESIYEKVIELAKRRGFLYPSYEIYGGAAGFYDYGPLGAQLKALLEAKFRQIYVVEEGAAEISTPAITVEPVLKASGHVDHFSDVVVSCRACGSGFRADHFYAEELARVAERVQRSKAPEGFKRFVAGWAAEKAKAIRDHPSVGVAEEIRRSTVRVQPAGTQDVVVEHASETPTFLAPGVEERVKCSNCQGIAFEPAGNFNLMFKTYIGPGTGKVGYLRPETAQAMFVDFPYLYRYFREKLPFAACQIGRAYRNEISPRQGLIRLREFNQMEVEAFYDPGDDPLLISHPGWEKSASVVLNLVPNTTEQAVRLTAGEAVQQGVVYNAALAHHLTLVQRLLLEAGLKPDRLRFRQHLKDEMAHYARDCWDAEFLSDRFGWVECVGIAYRTDYDLAQHTKHSGKALTALRRFEQPVSRERSKVIAKPARLGPLFKKDAAAVTQALNALDEAAAQNARDAPHVDVSVDGRTVQVPRDAYDVQSVTETVSGVEFVPHVIEPSYGQDRILYAILEHTYEEGEKEGEAYTRLILPSEMAPVTVGVFPLMAKDGLDAMARRIETDLRSQGLRVSYDETGTIGRRYARADEVGTPFAITVDYDSLKDGTVTVRDRDTTRQQRVAATDLVPELRRRLRRPGPERA